VIPLTITAHLQTPPVTSGALLFDGLLVAAIGAEMGAAHPSGWADAGEVYEVTDEYLPLARVEGPGDTWWWAASQIALHGPEERSYLHRRPAYEMVERWTTSNTVGIAAGPDKLMRRPYYRRLAMRELTWTCVGDRGRIEALLHKVGSVGRLGAHGHGWVDRWVIAEGGPPLTQYASDLTLRHLPAAAVTSVPRGRVTRKRIPLRPPYHRRALGVPCLQIPAVTR